MHAARYATSVLCIRPGPGAQHIGHSAEIRTYLVGDRSHVLEAGPARVNCERRIDDRGRHRLVVPHRLEAAERRAGLVDRIVAALKSVPAKNFVQHERPAGVGDVGDQRLAAQIGDARDVRLHEQMIEAVVAARDDDRVDTRFDQRHALVRRAVDDLVAALGETLALLFRIRRGLDVDGEAAPRKEIRSPARQTAAASACRETP